MPRSSDYVTINNLVQQNENDKVNEYFLQIHELVANNNFSVDQIINTAERQADITANVIDTGETFVGQTAQGPIEITAESAPDDLIDGLWLLVAANAYKALLDEDFFFSITPANFRVAVERFISSLDDSNKRLAEPERAMQEEPAEEPEAEEPETEEFDRANAIKLPHKIILFFYNELTNNRKETLEILNKKYNLDELNKSENKRFKMTGRIKEFYTSYSEQVIINTANLYKAFNNLDVLAEAIKIYSLLFSLPENYISLGKDKVVFFDTAHVHRTYFNSTFLGLIAIYYSLNKINVLNDVGFADIKSQEAAEVYREIVKAIAQPTAPEFVKQASTEFMQFPKMAEDINILSEELEIKKELESKAAIYSQNNEIVLKGW